MSNEENTNIDLGSDPVDDDFDPFASDDEFNDDIEIDTSEQQQNKPETTAPQSNPLEGAIDAAETKQVASAKESLTEKAPVFEYAGASENIGDTAKTFEELRIEKANDFPELEDGKRVSWSVEYGKITKNVADPKTMSIGKIKSEIETSKEFIDALKKSSDKNPACKLKPKVTAQSKGTASAYKGIYARIEDAVHSGKLITVFPARDGRVYQMRQNEMGRFITPVTDCDMLTEARAGFTPALPPVPFKHLLDIISLFRKTDNEVLVNIYWDKRGSAYIIDIPEQTASPISVYSSTNPDYGDDRYIHYMDIHSHCKMGAFFSATDNKDEKATRVYAVIGNVHSYFPEIKVRISNVGTYLEIDPNIVFEDYNRKMNLSNIWFARFQRKANDITGMFFGMFKRRNGGDAV